eukprot:GFUD01034445.1.p1 GENE.GFUD01034445.1~~GFUD01034445.1.p1  ORF type:complete len:188 (-),score=61.38 GFUD01034445.1:26-589(-)
MLPLLLLSVLSTSLVVNSHPATIERRDDLTDHPVELVRGLDDGEHILVRSRRSAQTEVCKYKKGDWSECDRMVLLMTRHDSLKLKHSSPECEEARTVTKNCRDKENKRSKETSCIFKKPKTVAWSACMKDGIRQKELPLVKELAAGGCPKKKLISKKCKGGKRMKKQITDEKNKADMNGQKESLRKI